jgi:hypothetical protein
VSPCFPGVIKSRLLLDSKREVVHVGRDFVRSERMQGGEVHHVVRVQELDLPLSDALVCGGDRWRSVLLSCGFQSNVQ